MALHPVVRNMLETMRAAGRPALSAGTPEQARSQLAAMRVALGCGPESVAMESFSLPTRSGAVPARLYRPQADPRGLVLYLHGGGWVLGALDDFDGLARTLAHLSGCALLLVDYRLAPEHPFPAGLEDVDDALAWANRESMSFFGRRLPLVVAGDSAGANLGIAAVLGARGRIPVALQAYFYPVTDCDIERESYLAYSDGMPLTRHDMRWFFEHYASPNEWANERIAVLRTPDVSGSPRTWIATAEFDVLRDEGEDYARRLRDAGVEVDLYLARGLPHGFARMFNLVDTASLAVKQAAAAIASSCEAAAFTSGPTSPFPSIGGN